MTFLFPKYVVRTSQIAITTAIFFLFISRDVSAQKKYSLTVQLVDTIHQKEFQSIQKQVISNTSFNDTASLKRELQQMTLKLQGNGYLTASVDNLKFDSLQCTASLFLGQKYQWASLERGNVDDAFISGTGFRTKLYREKPFSYDQVLKLQNGILANCENNGYPFATISLDSISIQQNMIAAKLNLSRNRLVKIDSILLGDSSIVAPVYMYNYIGIKPGDVYNESQVSRISNRIRELAFVKETKPFEINFSERVTNLYLYLEGKKASQFDGIVGVLPDNDKPGKVNLTVDAHLKLQNSLKRGEVIELNWKQLPKQSQDLKAHGLYPFLLNTPVGLDGALSIYKKDTTYLDVIKNLGIQYAFTGNNFIKAFVNNKQSSLLNTAGLKAATTLPPYADMTINSYGLNGYYEKLDYRFNPRKGVVLNGYASAGTREISKNADLDANHLYDSLQLKSTQYNVQFSGDYYFALGQRSVIDVGNMSAWIYSPDLFANELFRIGGLKSLRGFDEESIYASSYSIGKIEYRYLIDQNSFLFLFMNGAYVQDKSRGKAPVYDTPYGFGTGINFETKIGIMSLSYALGKQFDNPIYFRTAKVHFGIVNYF